MGASPSDVARAQITTERVVELATLLCSIPSPAGSEMALGEAIASVLDPMDGVEVEFEEVVAGRPNLVATVRGGKRAPLVLNGHLDASVYPTGWSRDPFTPWLEGDRLFAGGITDMSGGLAAMLAAVEGATGVGPLPGDLVFQAVMHHDGTGLGTKYALASGEVRSGYAICGEPSNSAVHTANGGAIKYEIVLGGRPAHISRLSDGVDALPPAIEVVRALRAHDFRHLPHPRLPDLPIALVGQLVAGSGPATVADHVVIRGDVRTVPGMTRRALRDEIQGLVDAVVPEGIDRRVRTLSSHQPFLGATDGPLVESLSRHHEAIVGARPLVTNAMPGQAFVTDAADLANAGFETVVYGPCDWRYGPDESADVHELTHAARVYLAVALDLLHGDA